MVEVGAASCLPVLSFFVDMSLDLDHLVLLLAAGPMSWLPNGMRKELSKAYFYVK